MNKWKYKSSNISIIREGDDYTYITKEKIIRINNDNIEIERESRQMNIFDYIGG